MLIIYKINKLTAKDKTEMVLKKIPVPTGLWIRHNNLFSISTMRKHTGPITISSISTLSDEWNWRAVLTPDHLDEHFHSCLSSPFFCFVLFLLSISAFLSSFIQKHVMIILSFIQNIMCHFLSRIFVNQTNQRWCVPFLRSNEIKI